MNLQTVEIKEFDYDGRGYKVKSFSAVELERLINAVAKDDTNLVAEIFEEFGIEVDNGILVDSGGGE